MRAASRPYLEQVLEVAVVGGGTAGSAAALFLARGGHRVHIFEQVPEPAPIGAGIVLQPTGLWVLSRLGLLGPVLARGAPLQALRCVTSTGRPVVHLSYHRLAPTLFGLGTHRGLLFEMLTAAAARAGVAFHCGVSVVQIDQPERRPVLVDAGGGRHGPFDLAIVADGARSRLRQPFGIRRQRQYDWGALWLVADDPDGVYRGELFQVVEGTRRFLGLLPTGRGPSGDNGTGKVSLFWSVRCDRVDAIRRGGLDTLKREVRRYDPRAAFIVDVLRDPDRLLFARYHDVVLRRYHAGHTVCLGDAAHSMSPQLGQGANLALWDAMVLGECIESGRPLSEALAWYTRRRRRHVRFYQSMTRWLTPLFQSDRRWLGPVRDRVMAWACRMPVLRARMLRTMCGLERGLLGPALPVEPLRAALASGDG